MAFFMCLPTNDVESADASSQTARVAQLCMDWQLFQQPGKTVSTHAYKIHSKNDLGKAKCFIILVV